MKGNRCFPVEVNIGICCMNSLKSKKALNFVFEVKCCTAQNYLKLFLRIFFFNSIAKKTCRTNRNIFNSKIEHHSWKCINQISVWFENGSMWMESDLAFHSLFSEYSLCCSGPTQLYWENHSNGVAYERGKWISLNVCRTLAACVAVWHMRDGLVISQSLYGAVTLWICSSNFSNIK